uniref:Uncharacterized protein n=1 Tax=Arundo donax TaxID=35708 RepID=A0A0A8ZJK7_ARUDO
MSFSPQRIISLLHHCNKLTVVDPSIVVLIDVTDNILKSGIPDTKLLTCLLELILSYVTTAVFVEV